ncbi:MAG TPA: protein-disulfide reductase DsbD family protein [Burkholderiaceae bacterium]|nr:protein-disulfide reductase DsbD family protein [Burkholderiaceae bacterium]
MKIASHPPSTGWLRGLCVAAALALALALGFAAAAPALAQNASLGLPGRANAPSAVVTTEQVRAELVAHAPQGVAPGQPLWLGLKLAHQPAWHTYWKNSGDSGQPTQLNWTLPAGLAPGEIVWPVPRRIPIATLANYGYEGEVLLPVPVSVAPDFRATGGKFTVKLHATWLACRQECIPQEGDFALELPVQGSTALHAAAFEAAREAAPKPLDAQAFARIEEGGKWLDIRITGLPAALQGKLLSLYPETPEVIHNGADPAKTWQRRWDGAVWNARVPISPERMAGPSEMPLVVATADGTPPAWRVIAKVEGTWPALAAPAAVPPALAAALEQEKKAAPAPVPPAAPSAASFWLALLGAFVGGMILNLMPCVFPILAIKVLGFAQHAHASAERRLTGAAYAAGVVGSFVLLGALMLALRAAGEQLGWGFQLQSPGVVAVLALLFTVIGLNLAGLFEFGQFAPQALAGMQPRHPALDALLSGVLAVAVASPCTAPFMGASLGLAMGLPAWQALAIFAAMGLGMALPYCTASVWPGALAWLPRPGPWMQRFKQVMAFPMFATVVWLVWVIGQQSGIDGAAALLALLVAVGFVLWSLAQTGRARAGFLAASIAVLAVLAVQLGPWVVTPAEAPIAPQAGAASGATSPQGWQPWTPKSVGERLAQGKPVFVDFTAAWCVTCQFNKKNALADAALLADFQSRGVLLLRADWTRRDAAITAALAELGRNGVPVYALYVPGKPPVVFTELLSAKDVREELQKL